MKSYFTYAFVILLSMALSITKSYAQASDDVYYDPNKDPALHNNYQQQYDNGNSNQNQSLPPANDNTPNATTGQDDRTDGYGDAGRYDSADQSTTYQDGNGNTYITNNYYDDDNDYYYTTRLRRFYSPNWGTSYYSYWYTPSYYWGWNSVNISIGYWYNDPWWRWNRHSYVTAYDPWYDPYWGWNTGWSNSGYYNNWYSPYYYNNFCSYPGYGYGCHGGGYGYWNGYYNGYYDGYYNGYYNNGGYSYNGGYYYGPRHRMAETTAGRGNGVNNGGNNTGNNNNGGRVQKPFEDGRTDKDINIPKQGITRPYTPNTNDPNIQGSSNRPDAVNNNKGELKPVERGNGGTDIMRGGNAEKYNGNTNNGANNNNVRPVQRGGNTNPANNGGGRLNDPANNKTRGNTQPANNRPEPAYQPKQNVQPQQNNNQPKQQNIQPQQQYTQPKQQNLQPQQNYQPQQQPQRNYQPQQQNTQPRQQEQRNLQPRGNMNAAPRQEYRSQPSYSQPQQRPSYSQPQRSMPSSQPRGNMGGGGGSRGGSFKGPR